MVLKSKNWLILLFTVAACIVGFLKHAQVVLEKGELNEIKSAELALSEEFNAMGHNAEALATLIANTPIVMDEDKLNKDILEPYFEQAWSILKEQYNVKHFQFHSPQSSSVVRLHDPSIFGDDLSDFRHTVVKVNSDKVPVSGIESGVYGLSVRGVAPVFSKYGKHLGSIEIGLAIDKDFIDNFQQKHNVSLNLYNVNESGEVTLFIGSIPAYSEKIEKHNLKKYFQTKNGEFGHGLSKVYDYIGEQVGLAEVRINRAYYQSSLTQSYWLAAISIFIGVWMSIYLYRVEKKQLLNTELIKEKNTKLKRLLDEKEEMFDYLVEEQKMASLGKVVAGVAHELNTPLGVIITSTGAHSNGVNELESNFKSNKLSKKSLEKYLAHCKETSSLIQSNSRRMANIIDNFKMLVSEHSANTDSVVSVDDALNAVINTFKTQLEEQNINLIKDIPSNLYIHVSILEFTNIFSQFISNTLKHGKSVTKIEIIIEQQIDSLVIHYLDDGDGLLKLGENDDIFEPFYTTTRNASSLGLGLSIVYNVITHKLGGKIKLNENSDKGFGFEIHLPVKAQNDKELN
ncbi:MAG: hypothetical protein HWE10_01250 [Gammaproteobacteria bacterium]|nr:hypothetical protein [Gammaproteobacteria bacterium]